MTFIQPNKDISFLNKILIMLIASLFVGAVWLIILYNNSVNLDHGVFDAKATLQVIQSQNSELKEKLLTLLSTENLNGLVTKDNFVQDKNPKYMEVNQQWLYASQY